MQALPGSFRPMRRVLIALVTALALAPAAAQARVVVRAGGYALAVQRHHGLCLALNGPGKRSESGCETAPTSPFHPLQISATSAGPFGLAVPAAVAQIEIGGRRYDTTAAPGFRSRFA